MTSNKKFSQCLFFKKAIIIPVCLLLFAFTIREPSIVSSLNQTIINDTLPQTEIFNLKRADIYVVITDTDLVKIRLKYRDSIMMNRTNFDALPANVKKEISAHNDGIFSSEEIESTYPGGPSGWMAFLNILRKGQNSEFLNKEKEGQFCNCKINKNAHSSTQDQRN
jgi:hypothetical protein